MGRNAKTWISRLGLPAPSPAFAAFAALALLAAALFAAAALGSTFGGEGSDAGQLNTPRGVAVDSSGNVYVADSGNRRIEEFSSSGAFVKAFGLNVVSTGPDNAGTNEVQTITVNATSGAFKLSFEGETTATLPYNATAAEVEAALNALPSIGGASAAVSVSGASPYHVTFEGSLAGVNVNQISIDTSALGFAVGTALSCSSTTSATTTKYQWLRNGAPIGAATAATYTTVAPDAGKAIQCQVTKLNANAGSTQASNPRLVVSGVPTPAPPLAPSTIEAPEVVGGALEVGSNPAGAVKLSCATGTWTEATSFGYQWYRNGVALSGNGANSSEYTVQAANLATAAVFQCAVSGENAGGETVMVSKNRPTSPAPSPAAPPSNNGSPAVSVSGAPVSSTATETQGVSVPEVCKAGADVCQKGLAGGAAGEFGGTGPQGVAVDASGDVYAADVVNHRVLEFDSSGAFVRGFGRNVGGSGVEVCTSTCSSGASSTENGAFGWSNTTTGSFIAVDSAGKVWVGDKNRLEEFEPNGTYLNKIELAGGGEPVALAADGAGNLYEKSAGVAGIRKFVASTRAEVSGSPYPLDTSGTPASLATDSSNDLFVGDTSGTNHILEYGPSGAQLSYFGKGELEGNLSGIAVYSAAGDFYASENANNRIALISLPAAGPLLEGAESATEVGPASATLGASLNPEGGATTFKFEYGTTASYGESTPPSSSIGEDFATHQASAKVEGLQAETTYHYRVVAHNPAGTLHGPDMTFTTQPPVFIDTAYTAHLTPSSVDLNAEINPNGLDAHYRFEWGETEAYGTSVPVPDEDIGSETSDVLVTQHLEGLSADTLYHWRVVATNSAGTVVGEDHTFIYDSATPSGAGCPNAQLRTNSSSALPDCRAYEQVSPVDKNSQDVDNGFTDFRKQQASVDGNRAFYESGGPFPGSPSGTGTNQYLSTRGASGWSTRAVSLPLARPIYPGPAFGTGTDYYLPLSPDLSTGVLLHADPALVAGAPASSEAPAGIWSLYVGQLAAGSYQLVTNVNPPNDTGGFGKVFGAVFQGASTDFSHIIFHANDALTPEAPYPAENLYEWVEGQLRFVGLIPTSGTSCTGAECTPAPSSEGGGGTRSFNDSYNHAISADGSRIVFSTGSTFSGGRHLYDRLNGTTTVDVSASQRTPPAGNPDAAYQDASVDGSHVLFSSEGALTNDAVIGSGVNLYDYNVETGLLTDLTVANEVHFQGFAGGSEDASYVYFVAEGALAANSNSHGDTAVAGRPNLYLWHGGQATFIATLDPADSAVWDHDSAQTARVTPDGAHLAFSSMASLTGYDNTDANTGEPDIETYVYDAAANRLICASCRPSGARPIGPSDLHWTGSPLYVPRNLSVDGSRLFFASRDALVSGDTNGLYDVYEWEADGSGSCRSSADNGGCLYLISSGRGASNSYFTDAGANGDDAFFVTGDRLVGSDQDDNTDLYDARVGGGFPESPPPAPCEGESCRGEASHAPAASGAGTAVFEGPGNPHEEPCPKGKVRRNGHCVKAHKHKHKHKRHNHRRHRAANNHGRARR
jgi:NHL repeat